MRFESLTARDTIGTEHETAVKVGYERTQLNRSTSTHDEHSNSTRHLRLRRTFDSYQSRIAHYIDVGVQALRASAGTVSCARRKLYLKTPSIVSSRKVISSGTRANDMPRHTHGFTNVTMYPQISHT